MLICEYVNNAKAKCRKKKIYKYLLLVKGRFFPFNFCGFNFHLISKNKYLSTRFYLNYNNYASLEVPAGICRIDFCRRICRLFFLHWARFSCCLSQRAEMRENFFKYLQTPKIFNPNFFKLKSSEFYTYSRKSSNFSRIRSIPSRINNFLLSVRSHFQRINTRIRFAVLNIFNFFSYS